MANDFGKEQFDRFVENLQRSGLVSVAALETLLTRFSRDAFPEGKYPTAITALVDHCIATGILTCWQCAKLRDGRWKGFFLERHAILDYLGHDDAHSYYLVADTKTGTPAVVQTDPSQVPIYKIVHEFGPPEFTNS